VEEDIIPTCRELGIGIVPYSPLGRGFFSGGAKLIESLSDQDYRKVNSHDCYVDFAILVQVNPAFFVSF